MQSNHIAALRISLASPEEIRSWSHGEVILPETINFRTHKPVKDGLFCERIFGPTEDGTCSCGKYTRERRTGLVCEKCGVEIAPARVRRERMGHIQLAAPVVHPWYSRGSPSIISSLLNLSARKCASVLAFTGYLVTQINADGRTDVLARPPIGEAERDLCDRLLELNVGDYLEASEYRQLAAHHGACFQAGTGAQAIRECLAQLDLAALSVQLREECHRTTGPISKRTMKRLQVVEAFRSSGVQPAWMILDVLPVLPPDLRPLVSLASGRLATSDLNTLYERVLHRNKRIRHFEQHHAPQILLNQERRMLQEAVHALLDNAHKPKPITNARRQRLKSLTDVLSGKTGRFRFNLLGKRVDYSGRSVIVGNPRLQLHQCGLPKKMACELFKPFLMRKLLDRGLAHTARHAKRLVERRDPAIWDQLAECLFERVVLLNRAPTLHRLSIQAFEPVLVEGSALQLHPQVCSAFNADFDGDQMAIHLPLSDEAQSEARRLMLSTHNLRSPASGEPAISISQEQVLGLYYLTEDRPSPQRARRTFVDLSEALHALDKGIISLHTKIVVRLGEQPIYTAPGQDKAPSPSQRGRVETTVGRLIFNEALPEGIRYKNYPMTKEALKHIVAEALSRCGETETTRMCDALKVLGFRFATKSGISFAISDITMPEEREELIQHGKQRQQEADTLYRAGEITYDEWYQQVISLWTEITDQVSKAAYAALPSYGTLMTIVKSGATKAKFQQIRQLSGMRGLMASPTGKILHIPVLSNYLLGLLVWEIFVAASGARKGFMDRSLNTAPSGYLTRKLVEVGMPVWVTMADCGTKEGIYISNEYCRTLGLPSLRPLMEGRVLAKPLSGHTSGTLLSEQIVEQILAEDVNGLWIRSPLTCRAPIGLCQQCYGRDPGTAQLVRLGAAVGVVAGQSIGEPGTQLTMRTFHSGGIANAQGDITMGLPRVSELLEAKTPKNKAVLSELAGQITIEALAGNVGKRVRVRAPNSFEDTHEERCYDIPIGIQVAVNDNQLVEIGTPLTAGSIDPKGLLELCGVEAASRYLVSEVQRVYRNTGVYIRDQHPEVIVRQMLRYVQVVREGDTALVPGEILDRFAFEAINANILAQGGEPASARPILLGLTRAALETPSWIAAASFQETSRVLTMAAIRKQCDRLQGLKEKIVLGLRIPSWIA